MKSTPGIDSNDSLRVNSGIFIMDVTELNCVDLQESILKLSNSRTIIIFFENGRNFGPKRTGMWLW
jgi:hypothetical protein